MLIELRYLTRDYKIFRFDEKKVEIDIEAILGKMKNNLEKGITPLNNQVTDFSSKIKMVYTFITTLQSFIINLKILFFPYHNQI